MVKAVFFDIDGTLLSHKSHHVPLSTVRALRKLKEKGILTVICTGRHDKEVEHVDFSSIEFDYFITLNGQMIRDRDGKTVDAFPFSEKETEGIRKAFNERKAAIMAVEEDDLYLNMVSDAAVKANAAVSIPIARVGTITDKPIYQIMVYGTNEEIESVTSKIDAKAVWWNELSVDVIPKDGGKDRGILALTGILGISNDEIITFGDGFNDIPMFKITPYSVAMGNASDEVKKEASYITTDIDDDGIANALKHFSLIS